MRSHRSLRKIFSFDARSNSSSVLHVASYEFLIHWRTPRLSQTIANWTFEYIYDKFLSLRRLFFTPVFLNVFTRRWIFLSKRFMKRVDYSLILWSSITRVASISHNCYKSLKASTLSPCLPKRLCSPRFSMISLYRSLWFKVAFFARSFDTWLAVRCLTSCLILKLIACW